MFDVHVPARPCRRRFTAPFCPGEPKRHRDRLAADGGRADDVFRHRHELDGDIPSVGVGRIDDHVCAPSWDSVITSMKPVGLVRVVAADAGASGCVW